MGLKMGSSSILPPGVSLMGFDVDCLIMESLLLGVFPVKKGKASTGLGDFGFGCNQI